jgi:hypothetical protein
MNPTLSEIMDFDHVIRVHDDGTVTDEPKVYAPSLLDDELDSADWLLLDGFSGQYSYSGPIMHPSEYISGGLEDYILSNPGVYVSLVANYFDLDSVDSDDLFSEGWAIAFRP